MKITTFILLFCTLVLSACGEKEEAARQAKFYAFGTEIDVSLYGVDQQAANNTVDILESTFNQVDDTWHAWRPSTLSNINTAISEGRPISVSDDVAELIELSKHMAQKSQNLFSPAAGKLFELWGFHGDTWFESRPPPSQADINAWLAAKPTMGDVSIKDGILTSNNAMVKLGFGGFAKGYAVDSAIEALKKQGITNAIINIGGDLRAIGSHGSRPWIIGIRHPRKDGIVASVALENDESMFTSGDYERFFLYEGQRYTHILDPRTGYPANGATSATVLDTNASEADAAATALFVAGDDWPMVAASMGLDYVMLIKPDGQIEMSPQMAKRARLADPSSPAVIREIPNRKTSE